MTTSVPDVDEATMLSDASSAIPAAAVRAPRDGARRYLDTVIAVERTRGRSYAITYFRWTRRGWVGDRPEAKSPQSWDELNERYLAVGVLHGVHGRVLGLSVGLAAVFVGIVTMALSGGVWTVIAGAAAFVGIVALLVFGDFDLDELWKSQGVRS